MELAIKNNKGIKKATIVGRIESVIGFAIGRNKKSSYTEWLILLPFFLITIEYDTPKKGEL